MLNPEVADFLVRVGKGEVATLGVRERGGVEVELHVVLLAPLHPALEVLNAYLVAVNELAAEFSVGLVQVQTECTGEHGLYFLDVLTQFVDVAGLARIVTCGLDTTGSCHVALETYYVVGLPAVERDRSLLQQLDSLVCINTQSGIALLCYFIILFNLFCIHCYSGFMVYFSVMLRYFL